MKLKVTLMNINTRRKMISEILAFEPKSESFMAQTVCIKKWIEVRGSELCGSTITQIHSYLMQNRSDITDTTQDVHFEKLQELVEEDMLIMQFALGHQYPYASPLIIHV